MKEGDLKRMETKLAKAEKEITHLQTKLEKIPDEITDDFTSMVDGLKIKRTKVKNRLNHFRRTEDLKNKDLAMGLQLAYVDMNIALEVAKERFQKVA